MADIGQILLTSMIHSNRVPKGVREREEAQTVIEVLNERNLDEVFAERMFEVCPIVFYQLALRCADPMFPSSLRLINRYLSTGTSSLSVVFWRPLHTSSFWSSYQAHVFHLLEQAWDYYEPSDLISSSSSSDSHRRFEQSIPKQAAQLNMAGAHYKHVQTEVQVRFATTARC
ncbi:hypothetical protein NM688_g8229 [Phlebia brevispora]|uniref:Uncharacterized protein n=1 Tax=Phlebia brevispora TaxID=194682 RepID=A0ACC1RVM5_9APHY|nr:hypothetical protein NM688_g8229 [Phlebia brevispora]